MRRDRAEQIRAYYRSLYRAFGPQHWWPGRTRFEVVVGAYLVQNTAWTNVERALQQLREGGALSPAAIRSIPLRKLELLVRPAGYFRQKARNLKTFVRCLDTQHGGSLTRMFAQPTAKVREELLSLRGVGPETADSILLYAGQHPVFVVDAYARRILERHGLIDAHANYVEIRALMEASLSGQKLVALAQAHSSSAHKPSRMSRTQRAPQVQVYNEMHGLLVATGKEFCRKQQPRCADCPLHDYLPG